MREMKDSGNVWYGKIPYAWELNKIKYLTTIRSESAIYNPEEDKYIGLENVNGYSDNVVETDTEYDYSMQSICKKDDILFSKLRPYLAKVFIAKHNSFCTGEFIVFSSFNGDRRYLFYSILNPKFIENINSSTYGAKMPRANPQYIFDQQICLPPLDEQQRIAEFLDRECEKIDGLKENIQSQIDTLEQYKRSVITEAVTHGLNPSVPMKDSGISWVGEIPECWKVGRIGGLYELRNQKVSDKDFMPLSVTMKGILPQLETAAKTNDGDNRKLVRVGDFAINSRSDRRGSCGISDYDGSVSLINTILKPRNRMNAKYYNWLFHTPMFADEFYKWGHGIVDDLWTTNWSEMKRISIPLPPLDEQQEIADYLDSKCSEIEQIIADKKSQIETLDSYKKSLIYEYVTGKKEVV